MNKPTNKQLSTLYIAIGVQCYGISTSILDAVKRMEDNRSALIKSKRYEVWQCPPGSRVDHLGRIAYPKSHPHPPVKIEEHKS